MRAEAASLTDECEAVAEPEVEAFGQEVWVGGRYSKYARNVAQTKWVALLALVVFFFSQPFFFFFFFDRFRAELALAPRRWRS